MLGVVSNDLQINMTRDVAADEMILSGFFNSIGLFTNHKVTKEMLIKTRDILKFLEIEQLSKRNLNELSSGEARRVMIARALVHKPKALLLDEPMNSLDIRSSHVFRGLLRKITKAGTNIIIVTHNVHDIFPEINRVILIKDGGIFDDGPKSVIMKEQTLSRFFSTKLNLFKKNGYFYAC